MTAETIPTLHNVAALRSTLVGRLVGVAPSSLQYWHETALQPAHVRAGRRGVPRLYSWADYHRLRLIGRLLAAGLPLNMIREAIDYLERTIPEWSLLTLVRYAGQVPPHSGSGDTHLGIEVASHTAIADAAGQMTYLRNLLNGAEWKEGRSIAQSVSAVIDEGPLSRLNRFDDAVAMTPDINVGLPTLRGTRLETGFLRGLVKRMSIDAVAALYDLPRGQLARAMEFEEAAA